MRPEYLDIRVPRNADYFEAWSVSDISGDPIDLTDCILEMKIRNIAGRAPILTTATITVTDAPAGLFMVRINGNFSTVQGVSEAVRLAYDLRITYADSIKAIFSEGHIILTPGVT